MTVEVIAVWCAVTCVLALAAAGLAVALAATLDVRFTWRGAVGAVVSALAAPDTSALGGVACEVDVLASGAGGVVSVTGAGSEVAGVWGSVGVG